MNMLSTVISLFALVFAVVAVMYAISAVKFVRTYNKKSVALAKLAELEAELTDQADAISQVNSSLKKLRSRITMRQRREDESNSSDVPDASKDPEAWKQHMRQQIHMKRFGN